MRAEPSADEFLKRWAHEAEVPLPHVAEGSTAERGLTREDLDAVARCAARLFGDRPLGGLTLGELAALPAMLETEGMPSETARAACRALGAALRSAIVDLPDAHPH